MARAHYKEKSRDAVSFGVHRHAAKRRHYLSGPSLQTSLGTHLRRIMPTSPMHAQRNLDKEQQWNQRFTIKFSKDNFKHHPQFREYFDEPRAFDDDWDSLGLKTQALQRKTLGSLSCKSARRTRIGFSPKKGATRQERKRNTTRETAWNSAYAAVSELNLVKHSSKREYFQRFRR